MIKLISSKVACFLCKDEERKDNYELYEYAVYIILSSAFHILTIVILGLCFNLLVESLVFYFSYIAIRKFAGGYHAKTAIRCYIFSVISIIFSLELIKITLILNSPLFKCVFLFLVLLCDIIICLLSPMDTENNPLIDKEKIVYKRITIIISNVLYLISLVFLVIEYTKFGVSIGLGIVMVLIVLIMRKIQIVNR